MGLVAVVVVVQGDQGRWLVVAWIIHTEIKQAIIQDQLPGLHRQGEISPLASRSRNENIVPSKAETTSGLLFWLVFPRVVS